MTKIYDQHTAAFKNVSAYVILKDYNRVATIAFKYPKDGAGRLYAYVHWFGIEMVRGHANGYGYDKSSAACESAAIANLNKNGPSDEQNRNAFWIAVSDIGGSTWERKLEDAGFKVWKAV